MAQSIAPVEDLGSILAPMSEDWQPFVTLEPGTPTPPSGL